MKRTLKILFITVLILIFIVCVVKFVTFAYSSENSEIKALEINNTFTLNNTSNNNEDNDIQIQKNTAMVDINDLISKDEKYTREYKTSNGEPYTIIGELKIDKINIEYDILSSTSTELLKVSLNKYWGAEPNEVGNMCVVGHNYLDTRFFGNLHKLAIGDKIEITDSYGGKLQYEVYDMYVTDPYDTSCTSQLTNGKKEITLITCYNNATQRLIVKAVAEEDVIHNILNKLNHFFSKMF